MWINWVGQNNKPDSIKENWLIQPLHNKELYKLMLHNHWHEDLNYNLPKFLILTRILFEHYLQNLV